jgi:hypothetical protein
MKPIKLDEVLNETGRLFENNNDLGDVSDELNVFKQLPDLLSFNMSHGGINK